MRIRSEIGGGGRAKRPDGEWSAGSDNEIMETYCTNQLRTSPGCSLTGTFPRRPIRLMISLRSVANPWRRSGAGSIQMFCESPQNCGSQKRESTGKPPGVEISFGSGLFLPDPLAIQSLIFSLCRGRCCFRFPENSTPFLTFSTGRRCLLHATAHRSMHSRPRVLGATARVSGRH
jgi:hypothetical protein